MPGALFVCGAWLAFATTVAQADVATTPIAFDLVRGPGAERCPDHAALAAQVAKRLSQTGAVARLPVADRVSIAIERTAGGHMATVSALGIEGGTRKLVDASNDCAGLGEALVLTLSMIADGRPVPPPSPPVAPPYRPHRPLEVGAGALGSTGILGKISAGLTLDLVWRPWRYFSTGLSALWLPSRTLDQDQGSTSFTVVAGLLRLCGGFLPHTRETLPALCAEAGAGGLRGAGEGYDGSRSVWVPWLVAGGSAEVGTRVHRRISLVARLGYLFSLRKERFTVGGVGQVYDSGHPGLTAGLVARVRFP